MFQFFFNAVPDLPERLTNRRERVYLDWLFETKTRIAGAVCRDDVDEYMRCSGQPERMSAGYNYYRAVPQSIAAAGEVAGTAAGGVGGAARHGRGRGGAAVASRYAPPYCCGAEKATMFFLVNTFMWTDCFSEQHVPLLARMKPMGADGVEIACSRLEDLPVASISITSAHWP